MKKLLLTSLLLTTLLHAQDKDSTITILDSQIANCDSVISVIEGNILSEAANKPTSKYFTIDYRDFLVKKKVLLDFKKSLTDSTGVQNANR